MGRFKVFNSKGGRNKLITNYFIRRLENYRQKSMFVKEEAKQATFFFLSGDTTVYFNDYM